MNFIKQIVAVLLCTLLSLPAGSAQTPATPGRIRIVIIEGEGAINNLRQRVAREPIVQIEDENRRPIAGAAVSFLLPGQGPGATFVNGSRSLSIVSDANGRAVARGLQPNGVNGQYQIRVTASHQGQTDSAIINQTNAITAAVATGVSLKLIAILIGAGAAVAGGVLATRGGGDGTLPGGPPSPTTISPGSPSVGGPQ